MRTLTGSIGSTPNSSDATCRPAAGSQHHPGDDRDESVAAIRTNAGLAQAPHRPVRPTPYHSSAATGQHEHSERPPDVAGSRVLEDRFVDASANAQWFEMAASVAVWASSRQASVD